MSHSMKAYARSSEVAAYILEKTSDLRSRRSDSLSDDERAIAYLIDQVSDMQAQIDALSRTKQVIVPDRVNLQTLTEYGKILDSKFLILEN